MAAKNIWGNEMPRKAIERSNTNYYHITARSNNRDFFYLPILEVWDIFTEELKKLQLEYKLKIPAFVLMNNHFHLLVLSPNGPIDKIMYFLMKHTTLEIQKRSGRINRVFGGRYKGSIIKSYTYLVNVYKYIYLNPVKAGITTRAEFYPYSTLYFKTKGPAYCPFRLESIIPTHAFDEYEGLDELKWINSDLLDEEYQSIKTGLRKTEFSFAKDNSTGKEIIPIVRAPKKKTQEELWAELLEECGDVIVL